MTLCFCRVLLLLEPLFCYNEYQKGGVFYDDEKYCPDNGRPSMDPVMLIKIPFIQYLYGIKSMRQTMKEIEVNVAYRWFLGLDMLDPVPHFSTFGKNYTRRFKDTDLFEHIFSQILEKSTDGNESRAYLCMHESEKTGKDPGKTRLEHSQIFVNFEENKKKRSFKRKMVLGIIPNTKFVYSLEGAEWPLLVYNRKK